MNKARSSRTIRAVDLLAQLTAGSPGKLFTRPYGANCITSPAIAEVRKKDRNPSCLATH